MISYLWITRTRIFTIWFIFMMEIINFIGYLVFFEFCKCQTVPLMLIHNQTTSACFRMKLMCLLKSMFQCVHVPSALAWMLVSTTTNLSLTIVFSTLVHSFSKGTLYRHTLQEMFVEVFLEDTDCLVVEDLACINTHYSFHATLDQEVTEFIRVDCLNNYQLNIWRCIL